MSKPRIHFLLEDMEVEVPDGTRFTEAVEATGADVTFGCKNGTCGTCRIRVERGVENVSPATREERDFLASIEAQECERLGCQITIHGDCAINYIGL